MGVSEPFVAVRDQRSHAERGTQGQGSRVVLGRGLEVARAGRDLSEQKQRPRLVATLLVLARGVEGPRRCLPRVLPTSGQELRLAHGHLHGALEER